MQSATFERRRQCATLPPLPFPARPSPSMASTRNPEYAARYAHQRASPAGASRRAKQRWHYADNAIRLPATCAISGKKLLTAKLPRCNKRLGCSAVLARTAGSATPWRPPLSFVAPGGIVLAHLPLRVVRGAVITRTS